MAIAIALLGFNDLGRSVTPTFLFINRLYLQLSPHYSKMSKKSMWEVKKISRFLSTGHGILLSCGRKMRETREHFPPIFWDLQPLWTSSLTKPDLLRFKCSSRHVLSKTKSVTPHFFTFLTSLTHHLSMVKFSKKNQC